MPGTGALALQGKKERIDGWYTFTVTTQTKVYAEGLVVQIQRKGETRAEKTAKATGKEGWDVSKGDEVDVYNAEVWFQ